MEADKLEDKIYSLDEAKSLIDSAIDNITESSDYTDLISDLKAVSQELNKRIERLERIKSFLRSKETYDY